MVSPLRNTPVAVIKRLQDEPWRFGFFAAVLWLERMEFQRRGRAAFVGVSATPEREILRFRSAQQLAFAASDLVRLEKQQSDDRPEDWTLSVSMMGLTGTNGVMPSHYSRQVAEQQRKADRSEGAREHSRDAALPNFLDLFNHRQISLFYRAWKKYRLEALYTRQLDSEGSISEDPVTTALFALIGMATGRHDRNQALRKRSDFNDDAPLYYAGAFSRSLRSPVTLKNVISDLFDLPAEVIEFQPQWSQLRPEDQYRMAPPSQSLGKDAALGRDIMIGSKICLYDTRFRIRLGPLTRKQFDQLLPEGNRFRPITQFIRLYAGVQWDFDIQLVLKKDEVPQTRLGGGGFAGSQLSRNSWSLNQTPETDQDQVVLVSKELN